MNERIKQRGVKKAREALAERVLSELTRSEEHRLSQGGVTTDDIKAERAKRRKTDPKAQRYMARGVRKPRGQEPDNAAAGHIRRLAGQRAATKRQNKKYADAKAAGNVTKVERASTEIIKNGRMALAEMVLEAVKRKNTAVQDLKPKDLNKLETGLEKAKPGRVAKATKRPPAPKKEVKPKNKKSEVLMKAGHSSSNHPDYLPKKLYKRPTKDGGYGKEGKPTAADTEVNQQGVRGHEAKIAKKKKKSDRQAKAQRMSNKIRTMRGLVPLMPGEKHSSNDKLGNTEN